MKTEEKSGQKLKQKKQGNTSGGDKENEQWHVVAALSLNMGLFL